MKQKLFTAATILATGAFGCKDPCTQLAERICSCEENPDARSDCRTEFITNREGGIETTEEDRQFCAGKLETCTCQALDENDLAACGFAPE